MTFCIELTTIAAGYERYGMASEAGLPYATTPISRPRWSSWRRQRERHASFGYMSDAYLRPYLNDAFVYE